MLSLTASSPRLGIKSIACMVPSEKTSNQKRVIGSHVRSRSIRRTMIGPKPRARNASFVALSLPVGHSVRALRLSIVLTDQCFLRRRQ